VGAELDGPFEGVVETVTLRALESRTASECGVPARPLVANPAAGAYILYTSGSTGVPKGVVVTQRALTNFLLSMGSMLAVGLGDSVAALATLTFDIATVEILLPLVMGATVILARRPVGQDPDELQQIFSREQITLAQATPSAWRVLLTLGCPPRSGMRIISGGEALGDLAHRLTATGACLWNGYGPTEITVYNAFHNYNPYPHVPGAQQHTIPNLVGKPMANTLVYVLDRHLQPCPIGGTGEIFVGGAGLARGYLNRPGLTAAAFLPNPFSGEPGSIIYRTGDLARWRSDGCLQWLGRTDGQLKIRGVRVEPSEIETALRKHPRIAECAVSVRNHEEGDARLVAFYVSDDDLDAADLRAFLKGELPETLIPFAFVRLPELPLNANRKLDRRALEERVLSVSVETPACPPATELEATIARIWEQVLERGEVDTNTSFFDLGGNSLLAIRVYAALKAKLSQEFPFLSLFRYPTIRSLAEHLSQREPVADPQARLKEHESVQAGRRRLERALAIAGRQK
jgi:nonribosomal peptide synthetase DhbF